jgi:hypothetical protein
MVKGRLQYDVHTEQTDVHNAWEKRMRYQKSAILSYKVNEVPSQARDTDPQMLHEYEQTLLATDPPP